MKNNILFIFSTIFFTGCNLTDQSTYQQQQVCKSLSQGYLQIQNQSTYELWKMEKSEAPEQPRVIKLTYKKPNENGLMLSSNFLPTVKIECTQQQQQVKVAVQQPTGQLVQVLELKLAETAIGTPKSRDLTAQSKTQ